MTEVKTTVLFYNHVAQKYKTSFPLKHIINPETLTIIPELELDEGIKMLDVACGDGNLLFTLANIISDGEFKGVDVSKKSVNRNNKKNKFSHLEFLTAPAENLPFPDNEFDIVTCTNAIYLFQQRVKALDEMYRVLRPGGKTYILEGIHNKDWKQKFDKILRQTMFIQPRKKYLPRSAMISKSYLIVATK